MKVSLKTEQILKGWCLRNLPKVVPLDKYNPTNEQFKRDRADGNCFVFKNGSHNSIFTRRDTIWYYRAWHDTIHLLNNLDFSEKSEYLVARLQRKAALALGISNRDALLLELDITLHIKHYHKYGEHPEYQENMIEDYLLFSCFGYDTLATNYGITYEQH